MQNKNSDIDIVNEVLEECILAYPVSSFVISLYQQYQKRGSLSKKQLQGLHSKAGSIEKLQGAKLATLEALIKKMPNRFKSELPETKPMFEKDKTAGELIDAILAKYPQHKRVVFLKSKYENNDIITAQEIDELKKFKQVLKL
jgi:molybdopterin converting factor small subunit